MFATAFVASIGIAAAGLGTGTVSGNAFTAAPVVVAVQTQPETTAFASLIPASAAGPAAVFAIIGPAVLRRDRPNRRTARSTSRVYPLPQDFTYFPAAR